MINNIINVKNKPHAILLIESKLCLLETFIKDYIKSIVAINQNDIWAKKIDDGSYFDVITINGYNNTIKKEDVLNIIDQFNKTAIEDRGIKIYIIYGVEHATNQAINSLLKFLEEPPTNTYAILTTRAVNLVLPTIKSRCQTYILKSNISAFQEKLADFNINEEQKKVVCNVYYSYDEVIKDLQEQNFQNTYDLVKKIINQKEDLATIKQVQEQFSKFNYKQIELFIKMLLALVPNNEKLFNLLSSLNVNPIKTLLFDNIWSILRG